MHPYPHEYRVSAAGNPVGATRFASFAKLTVATGADIAKARSLLDRAEHGCLVANSLVGARTLEIEVLEAPK
jgi:hypothetical protein